MNGLLNALEAEVVGIVDALVIHGALSFESFEARYRNPKATGDLLAYMAKLEGLHRRWPHRIRWHLPHRCKCPEPPH